MRQTWYDIVPHKTGWAIRTGETTRGKYATREEAFQAAAMAARRLRDKGQFAQVRFLHPADGEAEAEENPARDKAKDGGRAAPAAPSSRRR